MAIINEISGSEIADILESKIETETRNYSASGRRNCPLPFLTITYTKSEPRSDLEVVKTYGFIKTTPEARIYSENNGEIDVELQGDSSRLHETANIISGPLRIPTGYKVLFPAPGNKPKREENTMALYIGDDASHEMIIRRISPGLNGRPTSEKYESLRKQALNNADTQTEHSK